MLTFRPICFLGEQTLREWSKVPLRRARSLRPPLKEDRQVMKELGASDAAFKNFFVPKLTGRAKNDKFLEKSEETFKDAIKFLHEQLRTPHLGFVSKLCEAHGPLIEMATEKRQFESKLKFFRDLGLSNDQLIEAPWIFSASERQVADSARFWIEKGFVSPHPLLLIPHDLYPADRLSRRSGVKKKKRNSMNIEQIEREKKLVAHKIGSCRTNAALMERELEIPIADIYKKARHYYPLIAQGYRHVDKVRLAKSLGLDPRFVLNHYEAFVSCNAFKLSERVKLLLDMVPHLGDVDLLESKAILQNDVAFNVYYVNNMRRICNQDFSCKVKAKVSLLSYLLDIPEDLVYEFIDINARGAATLMSRSDEKLIAGIDYLLDAGFSGPEILRHGYVLNASLYHIGHAMERVKIRYDVDELSDAYMQEVVRALVYSTVSQDYNLLSNFVYVSLATLVQSSSREMKRSLNLWTRGRLRRFLRLEKTAKEEEATESKFEMGFPEGKADQRQGVIEEKGEDDIDEEEEGSAEEEVFTMGEDSESPWQTLKGNVELLVERGFDRDAILRCLFVACHSSAALSAECDAHVAVSPDRVSELTTACQAAVLNLIEYHIEKRERSEHDGGF